MIRKCLWCSKEFGAKPPYSDISHTHGICRECEIRIRKKNRKMTMTDILVIVAVLGVILLGLL